MFVRIIKGRAKEYAVIIRGYRDQNGKVRHKTVKNLGPVTDQNRQQMLDLGRRLIASSSGHTVITTGADVQETSRHNWGAPAIIDHLWHRFSLDEMINSAKTRQALKLMMIDRICAPASKFATYNKRARYQGYEDVELHNIYRSLDLLSQKSDELKSHIHHKQSLRGIKDVVFFDVTTLYFESQKADLLRDFGYSKDCKFNEVQIVLCLVIDAEGKPLTYEIFAGNTSEGTTLLPVLERLKQQFAINKLIIVADRGIGSERNLAEIKQAGYEYVIGAKLRGASQAIKELALKEDDFIDFSDTLEDKKLYKFINNKEQKWVVIHSSKRAQKDKRDRQRLIEKAQEILDHKSSLNDKRGAKKFIKVAKSQNIDAALDDQKIAEDARFDGFYAISFSQADASATDIVAAYHGLWRVEESFRTLKSFFEVRPMFHWTKKRIEGHIMLNFLLLVMEQFLLSKCCNTGQDVDISHEKMRQAIDDLELSIISIDNATLTSYARLTDSQTMLLNSLNIPIPQNHLETL